MDTESRLKSTLDLSLELLIQLYDSLRSRHESKKRNIDDDREEVEKLYKQYLDSEQETDYVLFALKEVHHADTRWNSLKAILASRQSASNAPDYEQIQPHDHEISEQLEHMCDLMRLPRLLSMENDEVETATTNDDDSLHVEAKTLDVVNTLMSSMGESLTLGDILDAANRGVINVKNHKADMEEKDKTIQELQKKVSTPSFPAGVVANSSPSANKSSTPITEADAEVVMQNAMDIFVNNQGKKVKALDYEVPTFKWKKPNPDVPELDPHYVFRPELVSDVLYCLLHNQKGYLSGHTGTGKTTLLEQICAKLGYPFKRINFDSEITRQDLVGREVLMSESGSTKSKFIDGIIPQAVRTPTVLCLDEIDFVRPDVAYVLQRALENKGFTILEDGDRFIEPHPLFRIFATANTKGQGDETGSYQGARHQSLAFLDRFNVFTSVPYLRPIDERDLLVSSATGLDQKLAEQMVKFANEIRDAFKNGTIYMTTSIRGLMTCAKMYTFFLPMMGGNHNAALTFAITKSILNRCGHQDFANISEIAQRVFDTGSGKPLNFKYED
jgi:cobaltochelatase CobS